MKTLTFVRKILPFITPLLILSIRGNSQNTPIGCNGQFFVTHGSGNSSTSATSVKKLTFSGSNITANPFLTDPASIGYNAIGMNPVDGYMYGLRYPASSAKVRLIRVGSGTPNNVVDLGEVLNPSGNLSNNEVAYAGCFDVSGTFYFINESNELYKITGNNYPATNLTATFIGNSSGGGSGTNFFVDIAIDPVTGTMYGVTYNRRFCTINTSTGATTYLGTHAGTDYIASLFFDEMANLYGYRQDGSFFLMNKSTAALTAAGTGPSYTYADGCSCSFGRVFHDLSSPKGICPGMGGINNPEWDITVAITNQTGAQKTGLTYTLEIPSNRFSITESPAVIAARLFSAGLIPANNPALVTISTVAPATSGIYNKIVVTSFQTGGPNATVNFTLKLKLVTLGGSYVPVPLQSNITGLPALIGSNDLSNDPTTITPDDPTTLTFCANITLPVRLLSFDGAYKNNTVKLNWVAENQVNSAFYEIERSADGINFSSISSKAATQSTASSREEYEYNDDLSATGGNVFFYRIKMVDVDGTFKYSTIIMIRKDEKKAAGGISISPNPLINNNSATVRFEAARSGMADFSIIDMSGKTILKQQNNIAEGSNNIAINNLDRLRPGMYVLQMNDGETIVMTKLSVVR
jgi:hypothetical protein